MKQLYLEIFSMSVQINKLPCLFIRAIILVLAFFSMQLQAEQASSGKIKNIILIIGDGMGPQQVGLLEAYARQAPDSVIKDRTTAFKRILSEGGVLGVSMTSAANVLVTDSAASASQLATGKAAGSEMIGIGAEGNPSITVLDIAKSLGKSTGLVSDVRITHATPAAFAAHQPHRSMENKIAEDLLVTAPDVMFSGGLRHWIPVQANDKNSAIYKNLKQMTVDAFKIKSKRTDSKNLLKKAQQQGYQLAFTKSQMETSAGKVLGLFANSQLPDGIRTNKIKNNSDRLVPSLTEMSAKAIEILDQNEKGFFLMIEAGLIDWAAHYNDTGTMLHEMLKINETINYVLDWAKNREDTLIIITADHETGGFGFSYSAADLPDAKELAGSAFKETKFKPEYNFGKPDILDKLYQQKLSYTDIFITEFDALPIEQQTPSRLMKIVNQNTEFAITEQQAARILETKANPYYVQGHRSQSLKVVPKLNVNDAFFPYHLDDNRQNLLAIEVATKQSVVWSNGTHTATPVLVFAKGNKEATAPFVDFLHHTQLGQNMINVLYQQ